MRSFVRLSLAALLVAPVFAFAQNGSVPDGSAPADASAPPAQSAPVDPKPVPQAAPQATSSAPAATGGTARPTTTQATTPAKPAPSQTGSNAGATTSTPPIPLAIEPLPAAPEPPPSPPVDSTLTWVVVGLLVFGLAFMPFGFLLSGRLKPKKDTDGENRCFDIKQLMEKKLEELTDVKAMLKEKGIEMGKEKIRDALSGSAAGELLVRAEKLQEQYNKLKKLFEECQIDIDRYTYKGVVVENSLLDKKLLEQLRVVRTRTEGERVLHDIRLSKKQIDDIQHNMIDTRWFFHLWKPGTNDVTVVFKDKVFTVTDDRVTWKDAIVHGVAHGIPESELDFTIQK